jgi:hypothetical protein
LAFGQPAVIALCGGFYCIASPEYMERMFSGVGWLVFAILALISIIVFLSILLMPFWWGEKVSNEQIFISTALGVFVVFGTLLQFLLIMLGPAVLLVAESFHLFGF